MELSRNYHGTITELSRNYHGTITELSRNYHGTIMTLSNTAKKQYRAIGHNLHPIVTIAQKGLSENIRLEIERALTDHELIKIKLVAADRDAKKALVATICEEFKSECVQSIGHTALLYRRAKKHDGRLSNIKRKMV